MKTLAPYAVTAWLTVVSLAPAPAQAPARKLPDYIRPTPYLPGTEVAQGTKAKALRYYRTTGIALGLLPAGFPELPNGADAAQEDAYLLELGKAMSLRQMLDFTGYGSLGVRDAVEQAPAVLKASHPGLLAVRYFSPKISDVSQGVGDTRLPFSYGWRKIVRLEPTESSTARTKGVRRVWVLFNVFSPADAEGKPIGADPFPAFDTVDNQLIVETERTPPSGQTPLPSPIYWFVYDQVNKTVGNAALKTALKATFDSRDPDATAPIPNEFKRDYHVPDACADCHGGRVGGSAFPRGKLNYVDTDHSFDRVQDGDDFALLKKAPNLAVLLDGGKTPADGGTTVADAFKAVFQDFREINSQIEAQNAESVAADTSAAGLKKDFALRAVKQWQFVHRPEAEKPEEYKEVFQRALRGEEGEPFWDPKKEPDRVLLPTLNRFCFRCHSSLEYHVFDKRMVLGLAKPEGANPSRLETRISPPPETPDMPQDRKLNPDQLNKLRELLRALHPPGGQ